MWKNNERKLPEFDEGSRHRKYRKHRESKISWTQRGPHEDIL